MHTRECGNTRFHFNSDLSGDVEIINITTNESLEVPGMDLLLFVGNFVRDRQIAALENMDPLNFLGGKP